MGRDGASGGLDSSSAPTMKMTCRFSLLVLFAFTAVVLAGCDSPGFRSRGGQPAAQPTSETPRRSPTGTGHGTSRPPSRTAPSSSSTSAPTFQPAPSPNPLPPPPPPPMSGSTGKSWSTPQRGDDRV